MKWCFSEYGNDFCCVLFEARSMSSDKVLAINQERQVGALYRLSFFLILISSNDCNYGFSRKTYSSY